MYDYVFNLQVGCEIKFTEKAKKSMQNAVYVLSERFKLVEYASDGEFYSEVVGVFHLRSVGEDFRFTDNKLALTKYELGDLVESGEVKFV